MSGANSSSNGSADGAAHEERSPLFTLREDIAALLEKPLKEMENRDLDLRSRTKALAEKEKKVQQREQLVSDRERTLAEKERGLADRERKLGRDEKRAEEERKRHELMKQRVSDMQQKNDLNAKEFEKRLVQLQHSLTQVESERDSLREQGAHRESKSGHEAESVHLHEDRQHDPGWHGRMGPHFEGETGREEEDAPPPPQPQYYPQPHPVPVPVHMPYMPPQQFRPHPYKYAPPPARFPFPQPPAFYPVPPRVYAPGMYPSHIPNPPAMGVPSRHLEPRADPGEPDEEHGEAENPEWRENGYHQGPPGEEVDHRPDRHPGHGYPGQHYPFWSRENSQ